MYAATGKPFDYTREIVSGSYRKRGDKATPG